MPPSDLTLETLKTWLPLRRAEEKDGRRMAWGYASTETPGSTTKVIVTNRAIRKVLPGWLEWGNIREMHGMVAAGNTVPEDAAMDERGLYIGAQIDDDQAWKKIVGKTYKGFSVGIRYRPSRMTDHPTRPGVRVIDEDAIETMDEISICDRPEVEDTKIDRVSASTFCRAAATAGLDTTHTDRTTSAEGGTGHRAAGGDDSMKDKLIAVLTRAFWHVARVVDTVDQLCAMAEGAKSGKDATAAAHLDGMKLALSSMALEHLKAEMAAMNPALKGDGMTDEDVAAAENAIAGLENALKTGLSTEGLTALRRSIGEAQEFLKKSAPAEDHAAVLARCVEAEGKVERLERSVKDLDAKIVAKDTEIVALRARPAAGGGKLQVPGKTDDVPPELKPDEQDAERIKELKNRAAAGDRQAGIELTRLHAAGVKV